MGPSPRLAGILPVFTPVAPILTRIPKVSTPLLAVAPEISGIRASIAPILPKIPPVLTAILHIAFQVLRVLPPILQVAAHVPPILLGLLARRLDGVGIAGLLGVTQTLPIAADGAAVLANVTGVLPDILAVLVEIPGVLHVPTVLPEIAAVLPDILAILPEVLAVGPRILCLGGEGHERDSGADACQPRGPNGPFRWSCHCTPPLHGVNRAPGRMSRRHASESQRGVLYLFDFEEVGI